MRLIDTFLGLWLMMRPEIGPTTFTKTWQVHSLNRTSHSQLYAARARFVSLSAPCRVRQLGVPFRNSHKTQVVVAGGEGRPSTNERVSGVIGTSQRRHQIHRFPSPPPCRSFYCRHTTTTLRVGWWRFNGIRMIGMDDGVGFERRGHGRNGIQWLGLCRCPWRDGCAVALHGRWKLPKLRYLRVGVCKKTRTLWSIVLLLLLLLGDG